MGLLSTEVEVSSTSNVKYYENLGYVFPRMINKYGKLIVPRGSKIMVNVKDLKKGSHANVLVECDICKKEKEMTYSYYSRHSRNNIYICQNCYFGENHCLWNPNKTQEERENGRKIDGYIEFIKTVLERDNYTCHCCKKQKSGKMVVHHLNGYNWYKEGRTDISNAITLCEDCHENFHSYYGKGNNTKEQYEEWIGHTVKDLQNYYGEIPKSKKVYCFENNKIYDSAIEAGEDLQVSNSQIYSICNHKIFIKKKVYENNRELKYFSRALTAKGKHFVWYDEYINMSESEKEEYLREMRYSRMKRVICLDTNLIFDSIKDAAKRYDIKYPSHIGSCCKGKRQTCGQLPDGTRLRWMYYDDYLKLQDIQTA